MSDATLQAVIFISAGAVWFGSIVFMVMYTMHTRWWRSEMGQHLMTYVAAVTVLTGHILMLRFFGRYPGSGLVILLGFFALSIAAWWRVWLLWKAQHVIDKTPPYNGSSNG